MTMTVRELHSIESVRAAWPDWAIDREGNVTSGWYWVARPRAEIGRPPLFTLDQLNRGLRTVIYQADATLLSTRIAEQARLRAEVLAGDAS